MGKKIFLFLDLLFFYLTLLSFFLAKTPLHLLISRIFNGVGSAMFYTSAVAMILVNTKENRGLAVGIYATLMGLGFSIGPVIGGFVAEKISYNSCYIISSFLALLAIIIISLGIREDNKHNESLYTKNNVKEEGILSLLKNKELLIACIGAFFISEAIGADVSFFPVYGKNLGLTEATIGVILGIRAILSTIVRIPVGKIADKVGPKKFMFTALAMSAVGLFLIPQFRIVWLFPVFLGLEGIGFGIYLTSANSYIGEVTSDQNKGAAVGFYNTVSGIGSVLNMLILGIIAGRFGVRYTFRFTSLMCFLGLVIIVTLSSSINKNPLSEKKL